MKSFASLSFSALLMSVTLGVSPVAAETPAEAYCRNFCAQQIALGNETDTQEGCQITCVNDRAPGGNGPGGQGPDNGGCAYDSCSYPGTRRPS